MQRYDLIVKQDEVSDELVTIHIAAFRREDDGENEALSRLVDRIPTLHSLSFLSDRNVKSSAKKIS